MCAMNHKLLRPRASGPGSFLLDQFGGAAAAYSLRRLSSSYTGPAVQVRRSSDNAEETFTPEQISNGSLASWVGSGNDGFVKTWYDQSTSNRNATQSTSLSQPQIVSGGTIITHSGKACLQFDGSNDGMTMSSKPSSGRLDYFTVYETSDTPWLNWWSTPATYSPVAEFAGAGTTDARGFGFGTPDLYADGVFKTPGTRNDNYEALVGYTLESVLNANISSWSVFNMYNYSGGFQLNVKVMEAIFFDSDKSNQRIGIESNMNAFYGVF